MQYFETPPLLAVPCRSEAVLSMTVVYHGGKQKKSSAILNRHGAITLNKLAMAVVKKSAIAFCQGQRLTTRI